MIVPAMPPTPPMPAAAGAPPAPLAVLMGVPQDEMHVWLVSQVDPTAQSGQVTALPHTVPLPHCQSTPHTGTLQQVPLQTWPDVHPQSLGQLSQVSLPTHWPSPHTVVH